MQKENVINELYDMIEALAYRVYELDAYLEFSTTSKKKKLINQLNALKETLVITTGDNYVGAAEPQLREKMTDIFQRIEENYGAPSPDEIQNLESIKNRYQKAADELDKIKRRYKLDRLVPLKTFEAFLKS
jgi:prefoldin subunit 5